MKKFDAIIVLGWRLTNVNSIPRLLASRLNKAVELYNNQMSNRIIVSGGLTNPEIRITEAEGMKRCLLKKGIKKNQIIKEEKSRDTIGEAVFIKQKIAKPRRWKRLVIVTSDFHVGRSKYVFKKVFGKGYELKFVGAKAAFPIYKLLYKLLNVEKKLNEVTKVFFKGVRDGDDKSIKKKLFDFHPEYADKIKIRKLIGLTDEELSKRFEIKAKYIKKYRKFLMKRFKKAIS